MTKYCMFILSLVLAVGSVTVAAETSFDPAGRAKTAAPYVDELTRAIVRVDLGRLEIEPCVAMLARIMPPSAFDAAAAREGLSALKGTLQEPGSRELYVFVSLEDFPRDFLFAIAPLPQEGRPAKSEGDTLPIPFDIGRRYVLKSSRIGNTVCYATPGKLARLKTLQTVPRPELAAAFAAAGDTDVQAVFLVSDDDRRVIEELYPTLPPALGGGPSTVVTQGLRWAAVGVDFPPKPRVRLTIQSRDPQAAQALAERIGGLVPNLAKSGLLGEKPEEQLLLADALKAAALLKPSIEGDRVQLALGDRPDEADALSKLLAVPIAETLNAVSRRVIVDSLKRIGLGMHNYESAMGTFPAQASYDANGRPLLSWRVHILPFLEENRLYQRFHLDEPWDGPNNIKLVAEMPALYAIPNSAARRQGRTCFVRPVGETTTCPGNKPIIIKEIKDGTSNTVMVVEVDEQRAVVWTKPDDIAIDLEQPAKGLGGHFPGGFWTTFCDGSAQFLPSTIEAKRLRAILTRDGNEAVSR